MLTNWRVNFFMSYVWDGPMKTASEHLNVSRVGCTKQEHKQRKFSGACIIQQRVTGLALGWALLVTHKTWARLFSEAARAV